jgi:transcriptional regulator with XRE-family HTH domain
MQNPIISAKNAYETRIGGTFTPNTETCNRLGIKPKRLTRILSGKTTKEVSAKELKGISELFGIPMNELIQTN